MHAKVTVNPTPQTPSEQVVRPATDVSTEDARGRVIVLRKPNPITKLRFIEAMGPSSNNPLWASTVWPLMFVASIDGQPVPTPANKAQIEALYLRLDEDGHDAVVKAHAEHFNAGDADVDEDLVKKS
ncbi:hypothetical protein [Cupriavidus basilensis]|uniref:Uncharacterized protein n=1 Tax=Cupriavidus basilensis TaxID=68895 RepID=A0A0C4Y1U5_9BURK|nr:hypothetical protein [Cupriavidus basilensis]AJG19072.1 hypothetical protein RR42_m1675 [Cupriavidus basilensis]